MIPPFSKLFDPNYVFFTVPPLTISPPATVSNLSLASPQALSMDRALILTNQTPLKSLNDNWLRKTHSLKPQAKPPGSNPAVNSSALRSLKVSQNNFRTRALVTAILLIVGESLALHWCILGAPRKQSCICTGRALPDSFPPPMAQRPKMGQQSMAAATDHSGDFEVYAQCICCYFDLRHSVIFEMLVICLLRF